MNRVGRFSLISVSFACVLVASSAAQEKRPASIVKWEYKILTNAELEKAKGLAKIGDEGWELVAVEGELREPRSVGDIKYGGAVSNIRVRDRTYYFKRAK